MQHYFQVEMPEDASKTDCQMELSRFKAFVEKLGFTYLLEAEQFTIETTRFGGVYQVLVSIHPDLSRAFREAGDHYARENGYEVPFIRVYDQYMIPLRLDGQVRFIAKQCHEANRAYCAALGDDSQPAWDDAPDWQRSSAIAGVRAHLDSDLTPAQSHESWMMQKTAEGWSWGPLKDPEHKQHPCMVPYDQLPQEQRAKDYIFRAIVNTYK